VTVKTVVFRRKCCFPPVKECEKDLVLSVHPSSIRLYRRSESPTNIISSVDGSYLQVIRRELLGTERLIELLSMAESVREMMVDVSLDGIKYNCFIDELLGRVSYRMHIGKYVCPVYRTEATVDLATGDLFVSMPYVHEFTIENEEIISPELEVHDADERRDLRSIQEA